MEWWRKQFLCGRHLPERGCNCDASTSGDLVHGLFKNGCLKNALEILEEAKLGVVVLS